MSRTDDSLLRSLNAVAAGILLLIDERIHFANTTAADLLGFTPEQLNDRPFADVLHPDWRARIRSGVHPAQEVQFLTAAGDSLWVELTCAPTNLESGPAIMATLVDITARRNAQADLARAAAHMDAILATTPDHFILFDAQGRYQYLNPAALAPNGLRREELLGKTIHHLSFLPPGQAERWDGCHQTVLRTGQPLTFEERFPAGDQWRDFETTLSPIFDAGSAISGLVMTGRDITDRKRVEDALREANRLNEQIAVTIPDRLYIYDLVEERSIYSNHATSTVLGYTPAEIESMGTDLLSYVMHPDDLARRPELTARLNDLPDGQVMETELRFRHADGTWHWQRRRECIFQRDPDGRPRRVLGIAADITARKHAEIALRESNARFRILFEQSPDAIFLVDPISGLIVDCNQAACHMNGYTRDELVGRRMDILNLNPLAPEARAAYMDRLRQEGIVHTTTQHRHKNGSIVTFDVSSRLIPLAGAELIMGIDRDITERLQAQTALIEGERLRAALQKEHEIGDLKTRIVQRLSHEFRTPLAVIAASVDMLDYYFDRATPEARRARFVQIRAQIERLKDMLEDMSLVSQGVFSHLSFRPHTFDLEKLCQDLVNHLTGIEKIPHSIVIRMDSHLRHVSADERQVILIVNNLVSNAIKYSYPGSTIHIDGRIEDEHIVLSVRDQGIGISAEDREHLFEPFFRGGNVGSMPGLGLGLSIVRDAVTAHRGSISLESAPGQGTTVTVRLPLPAVWRKLASRPDHPDSQGTG